MKEQRTFGEKGFLQEMKIYLITIIVFVSFGWFYLEELGGHRLFLYQIDTVCILIYLAVATYSFVRRPSEESTQPFVGSSLETKWTNELGNKIKKFGGIGTATCFLVAVVYMGEKALYVAGGVCAVLALAEYLLLAPVAGIMRNVLALLMIVGFMGGLFLSFALGYFNASLDALALVLFLISFVILVWGGGMDYLWKKIKKRYRE
ncbi:MAG: hypothetical protein HXS52_04510 [Theionarchaea archaeon]|nr:hypothetical protein [Theionarchaea archaeon]MBU7037169.1 hypothetical protein [Theionarchaea archaeon]